MKTNHYQVTLDTMYSVFKKKCVNQGAIQQIEEKESVCFESLTQTTCQNPTHIKNHFFLECIKPGAPCNAHHTEMDYIQKEKSRLLVEKQYILQKEFFLLCSCSICLA